MKAVYINEFGPGNAVELRDVTDPRTPAGTEVLVRVRAAGLNRADLLQAKGAYPPPAGYSPNVPGLEFAGEVEAVGQSATEWKPGDRVFGITAGEAQAEYLVTDAALLAAVPATLSWAAAAAVPEAFVTAYDSCFTQARLTSGEMLLIHAVASGVGLAALQLANAHGATVIGTSRNAQKLERCRRYGLDHSVGPADESQQVSFADQVLDITGGRGADVILDLVGAAYFEQNLRSLASKGRLLLVGLTSGSRAEFDLRLALQKRATIIGTVLRNRSLEEKAAATRAFASNVLPLLASGTIAPVVDRVFAAADAAEAYNYLASDQSFGKVVLELGSV